MFKQLNKKRNQKGFTLVELLVVIAIIGILAAIAIPQYNQYRNRGYIASVKSDAKNLYTAVQACIADNPGARPGSRYQHERPGLMQPISPPAGPAREIPARLRRLGLSRPPTVPRPPDTYVIDATGTVTNTLVPK